uniref:Decapping nuclease n=1 Tax=Arion vulgaris TaxID=1028688 RepID=A0A0B6Y050_9EUPU
MHKGKMDKFHDVKIEERFSTRLKTSSHLFERPFPNYRQPIELGRFSLNESRRFRHDSSQLRVFAPPIDWSRCALDLRDGYQNMINRDESKKEYLDDLLRWIKCNKHKFLSQTQSEPQQNTDEDQPLQNKAKLACESAVFSSLNTDFVCWRGLLTRLLCIPYENQDDILVAVIRFRGTYFMCEYETESNMQQTLKTTPKLKEMCAWGFKFEQYVTADRDRRVPDTKSPVNTNVAFCTVSRTRLASNSIVFGAEVDCEDLNCKKGNAYIELKTSRLIEAQRQHENFCKYKLIKWWAQSFLIGIPRVICGFRDDDGVVRRLQDYPVHEIPNIAKSALLKPWKPSVCFNFLDVFFEFVKSNITTDDERCVYMIQWQPHSDMSCQKLGDDPEFHFLPDWFIKWSDWDQPCA